MLLNRLIFMEFRYRKRQGLRHDVVIQELLAIHAAQSLSIIYDIYDTGSKPRKAIHYTIEWWAVKARTLRSFAIL